MCGVYAIRHVASGRVYIGSSVQMYARWGQHVQNLTRGRHHSRYLQHAWAKYGHDAFEFVVLETCLPEERIAREQAYIDQMRAAEPAHGFNISRTAGLVTLSEDGKRRISAANKGRQVSAEHRAAVGEAARNRVWALESRAKISANVKAARARKSWGTGPHSAEWNERIGAGQRGKRLTEECKRKISEANKGKTKGVPKSAEHRAKIAAASAQHRHTDETKAKMRETKRALFASSAGADVRARMSDAKRAFYQTPEGMAVRERLREAAIMQSHSRRTDGELFH